MAGGLGGDKGSERLSLESRVGAQGGLQGVQERVGGSRNRGSEFGLFARNLSANGRKTVRHELLKGCG